MKEYKITLQDKVADKLEYLKDHDFFVPVSYSDVVESLVNEAYNQLTKRDTYEDEIELF